MTDATERVDEAKLAVLEAIIRQANIASNASAVRDIAEAFSLVVGSRTST